MENKKHWYEHWQFWAGVISSIGLIAAYIFNIGKDSAKLDGRVFDTPEEKVIVIEHVKSVPPPHKQREKAIFDSIQIDKQTKLIERVLKRVDDQAKHVHHMDSIQLLNADQMFQIKEQLKNIQR